MTKASKGSVKDYLNRAHEVHQSHMTFIDVAEFGDDGEPVRVYAKKPTIADLSAITRDSRTDTGRDDPFEQALRTVVRLAIDENGDRMFTPEHLQFLRVNVDADVIEHLATRMRTGISFEAAKKKLNEDPFERALFRLAERLGRTVAELSETLTFDEFIHWQAHDALTVEEREQS